MAGAAVDCGALFSSDAETLRVVGGFSVGGAGFTTGLLIVGYVVAGACHANTGAVANMCVGTVRAFGL